jgi:hypothetical protein
MADKANALGTTRSTFFAAFLIKSSAFLLS